MNFLQKLFSLLILLVPLVNFAQNGPVNMQYSVSMEKAAEHLYHVELKNSTHTKSLDFKMCVWTPGYYQLIDFAGAVQNFNVHDANGNELKFKKPTGEVWRVRNPASGDVFISYDVKAVTPFVGNVYLDETRGYITPGGLFMYLDQELRHPVTIEMKPYSKWKDLVATGLDTIKNQYHVYRADDFDVLYDSPFLMGELEILPQFLVNGKPHNFIGYRLPDFDRQNFMDDLKKIVTTGSKIIGEVPYTHYTFLSIGRGGGGIEHLNSSSLSFSGGEGFDNPNARKQLYNFISHEYFHHYNVKRIRPIELGPFDYSKKNHTNMLWVSEGFTVYYEYMITRRAALMTTEDMLNSFTNNIRNYENKPGHLYQSATQASYNTWDDGPNGRVEEDFNKTISYYDKGPVLGLMLDFTIRNATRNKKTLDDVMRLLYYKYYKKLKRGFSEQEFKTECEKIAGQPLNEIFEYASTVRPPDYPKYFAYGGLAIDTNTVTVSNAWAGVNWRVLGDSVHINTVDYQSPAWNAGLRGRSVVLTVDGKPATAETFDKALTNRNTGDIIKLTVKKDKEAKEVDIILSPKQERSFKITPIPNPDKLQAEIYSSWSEGT